MRKRKKVIKTEERESPLVSLVSALVVFAISMLAIVLPFFPGVVQFIYKYTGRELGTLITNSFFSVCCFLSLIAMIFSWRSWKRWCVEKKAKNEAT